MIATSTPSGARREAKILFALAFLGVFAYAAFHLWQVRAGQPATFPDTKDFLSVAAQPIVSGAFLSGIRPPLIPLVWKMSGDAGTFVLVQTCISILAWVFLAWTASRTVGGRWFGLGAAAVILAFSSTRPIMLWNRSVLTESLALSALALLFATGMWWAQRPTIPRAIAFTGAAAMFALARDSDIWVLALVVIVLAVRAVMRHATMPRVAWVAIGGLGIVAALTFTASIASRRSETNIANIISARVLPYHDRVEWWASHGLPQARAIEVAGRKNSCDCSDAPVVSWTIWQEPRFREVAEWVRANGRRVYLEWLMTHPDYVIAEPFRRPERAA